MAKKNDNTILYIAAAGVVALLLLRKKATPVTSLPAATISPVNTASNTNNTGIVSQITNSGIIKDIADLFKGDTPAASPNTTNTDYTAGNTYDTDPDFGGGGGGWSAWFMNQGDGITDSIEA